jgi:7,8-dihydro-6-hydroxymethylpterin dimethyltransferase
MSMTRDYQYIEFTTSICPVCKKKTEAKIIEKNQSVFVLKFCPEHGESLEILEEDADYYKKRKLYDKPGNFFQFQSDRIHGCPFDCGLCPSHEQHTCVGLIEITSKCDLKCPVCYANSGEGTFLPYPEFEKMVDFFVESEGGKSDILQISGGEPTLHPDILKFIELSRTKNIGYVMLNTNGLRIAEDMKFVKELSRFKGGFEVYLQFDGFEDSVYSYFRGKPLKDIKLKAVDNLNSHNIPVTLVTTLENGINDKSIGRIIEFGFSTRCIRGINFQPTGYFGRISDFDPSKRLTITSVMKKIEEQTSSMIQASDFVPLPCNVDRVAITYFYKADDHSFIPLTRKIDIKKHLPFIKNTFKFDPDDFLKDLTRDVFSKSCCNAAGLFKDIAKYIPVSYLWKKEEEKISYISDNTFRISITSFIDAYNFDIRSAQKECVHFITPDLKKIPFSTYNLFYR